MDNDYPCAHSMDTCFFAVDRDGHVAIFDTGEAGAVPAAALSGEEADDVRQLIAQLPRVAVLEDPSGCSHPGSARGIGVHNGAFGSNYPLVMFLNSLHPVREEIAAGRAVEMPASEGVAVLFQNLPAELSQRLHESGACRGCDWRFADMEFRPDLAAHGLYCYGHLTENWISGPYGRERQPAQPIHVDQLPPRIRETVRSMRFETLCFAETPHIQPVEHTECISWESAYIDVAGKHIRPLPGREDEYAERYTDLAQFAREDNLQVEPPPGHQPDAAEE